MEIGNRIAVVGCPGSGKSTFSVKLGKCTGLPVIHLDMIWWLEDRTHISGDAFDRILAEQLKKDRWIIDGNYSRTCEERIQASDTVIFLDLDEETCMRGITERIGRKRDDLPWIETGSDPELEEMVRQYRSVNRPQMYALFDKYPEKQVIVLHSHIEVDSFLKKY